MKVKVSENYLQTIYKATEELKGFGCTYREVDMLNRIRRMTKYYLDSCKEQEND